MGESMKLKLKKTVEYEFETWNKSLTLKQWSDYVSEWRNEYKIVEVDGKDVIDYCENCHVPLIEDSKFIVDVDGCYICQECYEKIKDEV